MNRPRAIDSFPTRAAAVTALAMAFVGGCAASAEPSGELEAPDLAIDGVEQPFSAGESPVIGRMTSSIKVCLDGDRFTATTRPDYEFVIRQSIMKWVDAVRGVSSRTLMASTAITFSCTSPHITVHWLSTGGRAHAHGGVVTLFYDDKADTVTHELGHVFGLYDTYQDGSGCLPGQPSSLMCTGIGALTSDDTNGIREVFCMARPADCKRRSEVDMNWCFGNNAQLYVGDFNRDGRDDMLCHDTSNGDKWIANATAAGTFTGTNWSSAMKWCYHPGAKLALGDFNGDGRKDMLCYDANNGDKYIAYATTAGTFTGTNWSSAMGWCFGNNVKLVVGDFNKDGRDDMLCHDTNNGDKYIAYATASGTFTGTNWSRAMSWCFGSGTRLYVGDFNGDGRSDMLCHDVGTGAKWVSLATTSGTFTGTSWSASMAWCFGANASIRIGDFDKDGRDDMLCHDMSSGYKWVALADGSGTFPGTSRQWDMKWCNASNVALHVGDFDGNGATDLLCNNRDNGFKSISRSEM